MIFKIVSTFTYLKRFWLQSVTAGKGSSGLYVTSTLTDLGRSKYLTRLLKIMNSRTVMAVSITRVQIILREARDIGLNVCIIQGLNMVLEDMLLYCVCLFVILRAS